MPRFITVALSLSLLTMPAMAWDNTNTGPGPKQIVDGGPGAQATSHATGGNAHATAAGGHGGKGGSASVTNNVSGGSGSSGGGYAVAVSPPSIATTNNCGGGLSLGGFGMGGGGAGAALWELHDCRLRAAAVLLDARGDHDAAKGVWCQISEVRHAYSLTDYPCPQDAPTPTPVPIEHVVHTETADAPDYCFTASAGEVRQHLECLGVKHVQHQRHHITPEYP